MTAKNSASLSASFIMLCYNQEGSIREAVQSVLDQECEPIEIIISDDRSTDQTFDIIEEVTRSYSGPHRVLARQNKSNLGVNRHIECAIELASCDLMIWTAGDDTNMAHRAQSVIDCYQRTSAKLIYSDAKTISADGSQGANSYRRALFYQSYTLEEAAQSFSLYLGATAAWHKDLYHKYGGFPKFNAHEDLILGFRAAMEQSIHYIPETLVNYREGVGVSSQLNRKLSKSKNSARRKKILQGKISVLEQRVADTAVFGLNTTYPARQVMLRNVQLLKMRLSYYDLNLAQSRVHIANPVRYVRALLSECVRDLRNR